MTTLKPCPFCGNNDIFLFRGLHPKCAQCGACQDYVSGYAAAESWNARAETATTVKPEKKSAAKTKTTA
ncbi:Lar family restriction alleviation protein [Serratia ureilytica]|uniref:Restriction alleviation protein, Lar family n=1 Tax=Serratia ureilytica TaxID=300181 RepID=A0A9X9C1C7_9GAMM|nr:hypothetical protein [Serratia ureilytica]TXE26927.1 hypothetical protein FOT63_18510 [Serratia ureilytica]